MADDDQATTITDEDLERFAQKLEQWGQELPDEEQRLLKIMLSTALASAESEVEGFDMGMFAAPSTPRTFSSATMDALRPVAMHFNHQLASQPATYNDTW